MWGRLQNAYQVQGKHLLYVSFFSKLMEKLPLWDSQCKRFFQTGWYCIARTHHGEKHLGVLVEKLRAEQTRRHPARSPGRPGCRCRCRCRRGTPRASAPSVDRGFFLLRCPRNLPPPKKTNKGKGAKKNNRAREKRVGVSMSVGMSAGVSVSVSVGVSVSASVGVGVRRAMR